MHKGDVFTAATRRSDRAATPIKNPANYWIGSVGVSRRPTISAERVGVWAGFRRWIVKGECSGNQRKKRIKSLRGNAYFA